MIRRSVRRSFHGVYWIPPAQKPEGPCILVPNHHGWHDGYVMYHLVTELSLRSILWMEEFDAFPLFGNVGGMPFPMGNSAKRAATIRKTIRALAKGNHSLIIFGEGVLHPPSTVLRFGKGLDFMHRKLPALPILPIAIRYEMSVHERPECFLMVGQPVESGKDMGQRTRLAISHLLDELTAKMRLDKDSFSVLARGTPDVNERWDMRHIPFRR